MHCCFCNGLFKGILLSPGPRKHLFKFTSHLSLPVELRLGEFVGIEKNKTA